MQNKVVVITGGASGIGLATAGLLVEAGAKVLIADRSRAQGEKAIAEIGASKEQIDFVEADVSCLKDVNALMEQTVARHGGIDILFNNAGVLGGNRFPESDPDAWRRVVDVNVIGVLNCIHAAVPFLKKRGKAAILNMGSTAGLKASHLDPAYAMTKGAIVTLTRSLTFMQAESGISVNCLCPTLVRTGLAANSSATFSKDEAERFNERRGNRDEKPALTALEVAKSAFRLMSEFELTGYCCEMTLDNHWNLIPPVAPQKV